MSVLLRRTRADEIGLVLAMETEDGTRCWLGDSSHAWHANALDDPDREHLVAVRGDDVVGFVLLAAPRGTEEGVELRRIVIARGHRGHGLGRAVLRAATERVFEGRAFGGRAFGGRVFGRGVAEDAPGATVPDRLWLDVKPDNDRALALYESEGFVRERELPVTPGGTDDRIALVILARHRDRTAPGTGTS